MSVPYRHVQGVKSWSWSRESPSVRLYTWLIMGGQCQRPAPTVFCQPVTSQLSHQHLPPPLRELALAWALVGVGMEGKCVSVSHAGESWLCASCQCLQGRALELEGGLARCTGRQVHVSAPASTFQGLPGSVSPHVGVEWLALGCLVPQQVICL